MTDKQLLKPLSEYPRPQMVRKKWLCLNGQWDCTVTETDNTVPFSFEEKIIVPFSIETILSGLKRPFLPSETLWYRRMFTIPEDYYTNSRVLLHFEAVDWSCRCLVNGAEAGSHRGGYLPFTFDITNYLSEGENELLLSVQDPSDTSFNQCGKQSLNPSTIYYTATSGIWQTVWLEAVPSDNHIIDYTLNTAPDTGEVIITANTVNPCDMEITILSDNKIIKNDRFVSSGQGKIIVSNPVLWSPDNPFLYDIRLRLYEDSSDKITDEITGYFAFRKITVEKAPSGKRRIFLNGKPIFLHAPLDQGYWPESGLTPPSEEAMIFDILQTKEFGFNSIRKHIKIEPRRWYYHADRLGMLVMQDMISGGRNMAGSINTAATMVLGLNTSDTKPGALKKSGRNSPKNRDFFKKELTGMIEHLRNHPSIIMWIPFNESWGQFSSKEIGKLVETKDPDRLVDRVSGWFDQGGGSFRSRHTYIVKLKIPPAKDRRVYFISEYGGYNLSVEGHLWDEKHKFGYRSYKSPGDLETAYQKLIRGQLIPLISKGLGAAVYTQLTDVEIETNGFFTYDRKVLKIDRELIKKLNNEIYQEFEKCEGLNEQ